VGWGEWRKKNKVRSLAVVKIIFLLAPSEKK
jgi:uncharacterized membrane protein